MNDLIRVLYAEDDPRDADLTQTHFQYEAPEFKMDVVDTGEKCLDLLQKNGYDLLLLDYRLPDMDGVDILKEVVRKGLQIPVVMVTGMGDEELVVETLRIGASDYVPKKNDYLSGLPGTLKTIVDNVRDRKSRGESFFPSQKHILYVEKNPMDIDLTLNHFSEEAPQFKTETVNTCREAIDLLCQEHDYNLVLADLRMPDMSGLEFFRELKSKGIFLPMIIVTGKGDEETAVAALKLGVYDYMVKRDNYLTQLPHAIEHAIAHFRIDVANGRLQSELEEINKSLEQKVTERTEALRASEKRFRTIFDASPTCIAISDNQGKFLQTNRVFQEILGYSPEEIATLSFQDITDPQDLQESRIKFQELISRKCSHYSMEKRYLTKNGETKWCQTLVSGVFDSAGDLDYAIGIMQDITAEKEAQEKLKLFRNLIDRSNDAILVIDPETSRLLDVNDQACLSLGYTAEELLNMRVIEIEAVIPDLPTWQEHALELKQKEFMILEGKSIRKDGSTFPTEINVKYIPQKDRDYMVAVVRDVTERKNLEAQFLQSQKMEAVGRCAGGIAHDFNNLLTSIMGYADLLLHSFQPGQSGYEETQTILESAERASQLTRQLLAFSRKQVLQSVVLNPNHIIEGMSKMFNRLLGEDMVCQMNLDKEIKNIKTDPGQMEQVILNLVVNAREAMPKGGTLTIRTENIYLDQTYSQFHPGMEAGQYVMITLSDTGAGMDKKVQERIFEPFFTTKSEGTGLGLSTVYGIVKQLGGHIHVYSEIGRGTLFKIYLPATPENTQEITKQPLADETITGGTETILLLEDEASVLKLSVQVLSDLGYRVVSASRGQIALEKAREIGNGIDLFLSDVILPDKNGPEVAEEIRREIPELKVLYMSGYTDDRIACSEIREKDTSFLAKPFSPYTLAKKVRKILDLPPGLNQ